MNNMMNNEMKMPTNCANEPPKQCLNNMLDEAYCITGDCLQMASQIKEYLFGKEQPTTMNEKPHECFRDMLENQRDALFILVKDLAQIKEGLGI